MSDLYLMEPSGGTPGVAMSNDVSLLRTRTVAEKAATKLGLPAGSLPSYRGAATSDAIMTISAKASSPAVAVQSANAVAQVFLQVRSDQFQSQTNLVVNGLSAQIKSLEADLVTKTKAMSALTARDPQTRAQFTELQSETGSDTTQITSLKNQLTTSSQNQNLISNGSFVVDPATSVPPSGKKAIIKDALSGLVAGLAIGLGAIVMSEMLSDRLHRREDVAAALGAPVELSVGRFVPPRLTPKWWLRRRLGRPGRQLRMLAKRLRTNLELTPSQALAVISLSATQSAALGVALVARTLAAEGKNTLVVDMAKGRPLADLFGVKGDAEGIHTIDTDESPLRLIVSPQDPAELPDETLFLDSDVVLVLASIEPAFGAEHIATWATEAVVMVRSGRATGTGVRAGAQILREARIDIRSAILIGAHRSDESAGLVPKEPIHPFVPDTVDTLSLDQW